MTRKVWLLILTVFAAGSIFAQTSFAKMAKNTITLDTGPIITGIAISKLGDMISDSEGLSTSGFGFALQYERQINQKFTVAGRFAYLSGTIGYKENYLDNALNSTLSMELSSFSIEGHARYYPKGRIFFLDGMLGYANMSADFSGELLAANQTDLVSVLVEASRGFFKFGAKLGWRISFGKNGGFTFEPSLGYYGGISGGDTLGRQLLASLGVDQLFDINDIASNIDIISGYLEDFIFIGGPRVSLAFGYRF